MSISSYASLHCTSSLNMVSYLHKIGENMAQGAKNLLGKVFGKLTVLSYGGSDTDGTSTKGKWKCLCSCGKETMVYAYQLLRNITKSCGCRNYIDHIGDKFWRLTVIEKVSIKGRRAAFFKCKCDCGKETIVQGGHLRAGKRKSCGCKAYDHVLENGMFRLYTIYKQKSKYDFDLTYEFFKECLKSVCFYCGNSPQGRRKNCYKGPVLEYNGIDRIDSSKGYIQENCVPCCKFCNRAKNDFSIKDWYNHMKKVLAYSGAKYE
jgi:hypothetical protein